MALTNMRTFDFDSIDLALDFCKPLLIEGYQVAINTNWDNHIYPIDTSRILNFTVSVGGNTKYASKDNQDETNGNKE